MAENTVEKIEHQNCQIVEHNVADLIAKVVALTLDGWVVNSQWPGQAIGTGGSFILEMDRNAASVDAFKEKAEATGAQRRMSNQEALAHARSFRGKAKLNADKIQEA